jgi:ATP-dependent RNA helicase RhlE
MTETSSPVPFSQLPLDPVLLKALSDLGYTSMTPIQAQAIPVVLQGRDVMGAAQTGTGKTAAFTLPLLQRLLAHQNTSASPARHPTRALVLLPTRELADQVAQSVQAYAKGTSLRSTVVFGGVDIKPQALALRQGVEILVATPGRLLDHLQAKHCTLNQVEYVVLDEADRMLDIGFLPDLERILNFLPAKRITLLFSATFSSDIKKLAQSYLKDPVLIEVARPNQTASTITQCFYLVEEDKKRDALWVLLQILQDPKPSQLPELLPLPLPLPHPIELQEPKEPQKPVIPRPLTMQTIVFVNSKQNCGRLATWLSRQGIQSDALHGDKSQEERLKALEGFKTGRIHVLVATDVAARGLDIVDLPRVINFDMPWNPEDYVHRIGRTGRAGAQGLAITFVSPEQDKLVKEIGKLTHQVISLQPLPLPILQAKNTGVSRHKQPHRAASPSSSFSPASSHDPWFDRPYEACDTQTRSTSASAPSSPTIPKTATAITRRNSKPVAAALFKPKSAS